MKVTFFSILMSILWSSILILVTHMLRKKRFFLNAMGLPVFFAFYLLSIIRMIFPFELPFVQEIAIRGWFSQIMEHIYFDTKTVFHLEWSWAGVAVILWAAVSVILTGSFLIQYMRNIQRISNSLPARDKEAEACLAALQKDDKRRIPVSIFRCKQVQSPIGIGLLNRKILLPEGTYSKTELSYILLHEYTHFLQHDLLIKMVTQLYCCLFWWNPLVYLLRKDITQMLELKCDLAVTKLFSDQQKIEYLETILLVLRKQAVDVSQHLFLATPFLQSNDSLSIIERFNVISVGKTLKSMVNLFVFLGAFFLFCFSYLFVFQSAYDPPTRDIYSSENIKVPNFGDIYLVTNEDGTYSLIPENGSPILINDPTVLKILLHGNIPVIEKNEKDGNK